MLPRPLFACRGSLRAAFLAACALLAVAPTRTARAELAEAQARRAMSLARTTQSPFCPGKTLDACPSTNAAQWRADIRHWVARGASDAEIRARLEARVPGTDLEGHPMGASSYWLPLMAFAVATLALLAWALRHVRRAPLEEDAGGQAADAGDALDARLDGELKRLG